MGQIMPKLLQSIEANMPVIIERLKNRAIEKGYQL
jgi:hypothetical protein